MDWSIERWVKLYTRDTSTWLLLTWQARTVLLHMLRKVDALGRITVGEDGREGLAAVLALPLEIVESGLEGGLLRRDVARELNHGYLLPRFAEAQAARTASAERVRQHRNRMKQDETPGNAEDDFVTPDVEMKQGVTIRSDQIRDRALTRSARSLGDPDRSDQSPARSSAKPRRRLPDDWTPSDQHRARAAELGLDVDREHGAFRDHHRAKGTTMADWDAAFRTWLRNADRFAQQDRARSNGRSNGRRPMRGADILDELQAEARALRESEDGEPPPWER